MSASFPSTHWLRIELLTDVVFSRRNATVGVHECLDYVPGSALLGAAAARLYSAPGFGPDFFLSGRVRFGDGLPDNGEGSPAWPAPLSHHVGKGDRAQDGNLINLLTEEIAPGVQPVQVRNRHLMADGSRAAVRKRYQLKTAVNRAEFGRALDESLHGYDAIQSGQVFLAPVTFAPDVPEEAIDKLIALLVGGTIRLGRSRSAQFGRVRIGSLTSQPSWPSRSAALQDAVVLYLASDLALTNSFGAPTLIPEAAHFGLPAGAGYIPAKSFVRTRRYAPWNAFRGGHDTDRQVLERGGVLVFSAPEGIDRATLAQRLENDAVGLYTHEGLGRVFVDPEFVVRARPASRGSNGEQPPIIQQVTALAVPSQLTEVALAHCLVERARSRRIADQAHVVATQWFSAVWSYTQHDDHPFPSRSQWNDVRNLTQSGHVWFDNLKAYLFPNPASKRAEVWCRVPTDRKNAKSAPALGETLLAKIDDLQDRELARAAIRETVTAVIRRLQQPDSGIR